MRDLRVERKQQCGVRIRPNREQRDLTRTTANRLLQELHGVVLGSGQLRMLVGDGFKLGHIGLSRTINQDIAPAAMDGNVMPADRVADSFGQSRALLNVAAYSRNP